MVGEENTGFEAEGDMPSEGVPSGDEMANSSPFDDFDLGDSDEMFAIIESTVENQVKSSHETKELTAVQKDTLIRSWASKLKMFYRVLKRSANKLTIYCRHLYPEVRFDVLFSGVNLMSLENEIASAVIIGKSPFLMQNSKKLSPVEKYCFSEWGIDLTPAGFLLVERFFYGNPENVRSWRVVRAAKKLAKLIPNGRLLEEVSCQSVLTRPEVVSTLEINRYFNDLVTYFRLTDKKHTAENIITIADIDPALAAEAEKTPTEHFTLPLKEGETAAPTGQPAATGAPAPGVDSWMDTGAMGAANEQQWTNPENVPAPGTTQHNGEPAPAGTDTEWSNVPPPFDPNTDAAVDEAVAYSSAVDAPQNWSEDAELSSADTGSHPAVTEEIYERESANAYEQPADETQVYTQQDYDQGQAYQQPAYEQPADETQMYTEQDYEQPIYDSQSFPQQDQDQPSYEQEVGDQTLDYEQPVGDQTLDFEHPMPEQPVEPQPAQESQQIGEAVGDATFDSDVPVAPDAASQTEPADPWDEPAPVNEEPADPWAAPVNAEEPEASEEPKEPTDPWAKPKPPDEDDPWAQPPPQD